MKAAINIARLVLVMPPVILPAILLLSFIFAPLVRPRKNAGCARRHIAFARRWCSLWHIRSVNDKIRGRTGFPSHSGEGRSEEHTSELQSLMRISYAVFCLKKQTTNTLAIYKHHDRIAQTQT